MLKKRAIIFFIIFLAILFGGTYLLLSGRTFYADLVLEKVADAFRATGGYELGVGELSGNPITGVEGAGVSVLHDDVEILSADMIELKLSLPSVVTSPKLASLTLSGARADVTTIMQHLPPSDGESSGAPALEKLILLDSEIKTPYGWLALKSAKVAIGSHGYGVDIEGAFMDFPLKVEGDIDNSGGGATAKNLRLEWNGMSFAAEGTLSPMRLTCEVRGLDADFLGEVFPEVKASTVRGIYSGSFTVENTDGISAAGSLTSTGGGVWILPFDKMSAGLDFRDNTLSLGDIEADILGSKVLGDAVVKLATGALPSLDLKFEVSGLAMERMQELFPAMDKISGIVDVASCDISGPVNSLGGNIALSGKKLDAYDFAVTDLSATAALKKSSSLGVTFAAKSMGANIKGNGWVIVAPSVKLGLDVALSGISLEVLGKRFPAVKNAGIGGTGGVKANISGPGDAITVKGDILFPELSLKGEYEASDVAASFEYSNNALSLSKASAVFNGARLTAASDKPINFLDSDDSLAFEGSVTDARLERFAGVVPFIGDYNVMGTASANWVLSGTLASPTVNVDLKMPSLSLMKQYKFTGISTRAAYSDMKIEIESAAAKMGRASAVASGIVALPVADAPLEYNVKGSFEKIYPEDFVKLGIISADVSGDLAGDFRVWSEQGAPPAARVYFKDARVIYSNVFDISNLRGSVTLQDGGLRFDGLRTLVNTGQISVNGSVGNVLAEEFSPEKMALNLDVSVKSADIGRVSRLFLPMSKGYQGVLNATAKVKGTVASPLFDADARLLGVRAFGLFLPILRVDGISGSMNEINIPKVRAIVGRGVIDAKGSLKNLDGWKAHVSATGKSVDIRSLAFSLEEDMRREITGTLNFDFEGDGWMDAFEGHGEVRVPEFSGMGIKVTDFCAPFWVNDGFVLIEESTAKFYGGVLKAQVAKDLDLSNWGGRVEIKSADFSPLMQDLMPDSEGIVTGSLDFTLRIAGDSTRTSMQDGSGNAEIKNGEVIGFPGTEAVSSLIGGRPLRFASALFSYSIDGKSLYLLPGSRVSAPSEDPVFKYVMVDGNIVAEDKKIDLSCVGNVNIRALNSFASGVQGLVSAAMEDTGDTEAMLHNFLGGALSGFSRNEFRDVSLIVSGTPGALAFSKVEIAAPVVYDAKPEILNQTGNNKEKEEERFKLKLEFPVGPGGGHGDNLGGQVGGQIFEQAIKGLFSF